MENQTVKEFIPTYYQENRFGPDGGESKPFVKINLLFNIPLYLPNVADRKKVILLHDIHHILTGYKTDFKGEMEISSWELSTGCANNWVAFTLNTYTFTLGIFSNLRGIWKAWNRGSSTKNLYQLSYSKTQLFDKYMNDLKQELGLMNEVKGEVSLGTVFSFAGFLFVALLFSLLSVALLPPVIIYQVYAWVKYA